ncbi:hypothetical protein SB751_09665 [Cupriavidus sp. SIMBA_020]|uniref:hypothetical protein n=1 Tax=Cupriavidus sp. SIMBA_020 TaxID=3085766 RepID=UPI00397D85FC
MGNANDHPLENDAGERDYFERISQHSNAVGQYRRLTEKLTGYLPTWAERKRAGRKPKTATKEQA